MFSTNMCLKRKQTNALKLQVPCRNQSWNWKYKLFQTQCVLLTCQLRIITRFEILKSFPFCTMVSSNLVISNNSLNQNWVLFIKKEYKIPLKMIRYDVEFSEITLMSIGKHIKYYISITILGKTRKYL